MDDVNSRIAVRLKFSVVTYRQIEAEVRKRADLFFDGDPYEVGWIDVTVEDNHSIDVEASVNASHGHQPTPLKAA